MALQAYSLARDGSTALSPHFCVREFRCKDGSDPVFIDTALAELLERIREPTAPRHTTPRQAGQSSASTCMAGQRISGCRT